MGTSSARTNDSFDFENLPNPLWVVLSLREFHEWLGEFLGPMASEVLAIFVDCVFAEDPRDGGAPQAFRRLHRTLTGQGLDRFEAERVMREGYGKLLSFINEALPGWDHHHHYHGVEYSMRGCKQILLAFRPEISRRPYVQSI